MSGDSVDKYLADRGLDTSFTPPTYTPDIENWEYHEIYPKYPINDSSNSVEFVIGGAHDPHFVAPDSFELFGKYRVVKQDGTPINIAADRDGLVSGCNLFPQAIWENVNVFLNGVQISDTGRDYHHKAYMSHNYSYTDVAKVKHLKGDYFIQNGKDDTDQTTATYQGEGFTKRVGVGGSNVMQPFCIPLVIDFANVEQLTPGLELRIVLEKNRIDIPIQSVKPDLQLKLQLEDLRLQFRRYLTPYPADLILSKFFNKPQYFPIDRVTMRRRQIGLGQVNVIVPGLALGQQPSRVMVAICSVDQLNNIIYDPFCYSRQNLRDYQFLRGGRPLPSWSVSLDGENLMDNIRAYKFFTKNCGYHNDRLQCGPTLEEYMTNQFVMTCDLSADNSAGYINHLPEQNGELELKLTFKAPTVKPLNLIIMSHYENCIMAHKSVITMDYTI